MWIGRNKRKLSVFVWYILGIGLLTGQSTLISPDRFNAMLSDTSIQKLDVRSGVEYDVIGHIPDFIQINVLDKNFSDKVKAALNPDKPVLVTCFSGHRSVDAVTILSQLGFKNIYELKGGLIAWMQAGYKLE